MASPFIGLEVEEELRPVAQLLAFDLDECLSSVVALEAKISREALSARTLGTTRIGNATVIEPQGVLLTIGYLVTEAEEVILTAFDGRRIPAHVLGVDQATGFGLIHALEPLGLPAVPLGDSRSIRPYDVLVSAGAGGEAHALSGRLLARAPFAGYWEYLLDEALFVEPAHPHWSGAALIGPSGELLGVGSLRMEQLKAGGRVEPFNMFVPIELAPPIMDDLARGRPGREPRPWLGVFAQERDSRVVVLDVSPGSPASRAELRQGDAILKIDGRSVSDLASFYRRLWALGPPGVIVPLTLRRDGDVFDVEVRSADRVPMLKKPRLN
jgi:S1-C subfamily serine protease